MNTAHCYFCTDLTDSENMFPYEDTLVRVCENCQMAYGFVEPIEENDEEDKNENN